MVCTRGYPAKLTGTITAAGVEPVSTSLACVSTYKVKWRLAPFTASSIDINTNNLPIGIGGVDVIE